jgi:hypothetical protein
VTKPTILAVDDDPGVLASITRDLRSRYGQDYRIVRASSGPRRSRCSPSSRCGPAPWR